MVSFVASGKLTILSVLKAQSFQGAAVAGILGRGGNIINGFDLFFLDSLLVLIVVEEVPLVEALTIVALPVFRSLFVACLRFNFNIELGLFPSDSWTNEHGLILPFFLVVSRFLNPK